MRYIPILLSDVSLSISAPSDVYVHIYPVKKESIIKIYLFDSANKIDILHKDKEKIIIKLDTDPESIFIITRNYIAELRNVINIYVLKDYEELNIDDLKIDIDIEYEYYNDDYDYRFYLKIQTE